MEIIQIGNVKVNSGVVQIGDPCHFIENYDLSPVVGEKSVENEIWNANAAREIVRLSVEELSKSGSNAGEQAVSMPFPETKETVNTAGEPGLGVVCAGFGGDGVYPVYGVFASETWPHLMTGMFIDFGNEPVSFAEKNIEASFTTMEGDELPVVNLCELPDPDLNL